MLKINNPHFKSQIDLAALDLAPKVKAYLTANAQAVGAVATMAELKAGLVEADRPKLTRAVFNEVCKLNGYEIINPEDAAE